MALYRTYGSTGGKLPSEVEDIFHQLLNGLGRNPSFHRWHAIATFESHPVTRTTFLDPLDEQSFGVFERRILVAIRDLYPGWADNDGVNSVTLGTTIHAGEFEQFLARVLVQTRGIIGRFEFVTTDQ